MVSKQFCVNLLTLRFYNSVIDHDLQYILFIFIVFQLRALYVCIAFSVPENPPSPLRSPILSYTVSV